MFLIEIPYRSDTVKIIRAHTIDLYSEFKLFLKKVDDTERQTFIRMMAELEFEFTRN